MTPEQKARQQIDQQLDQCGWLVQDYAKTNILAGPGIAVREFPLTTGAADYLLYADGKAIGVVEAKPEGYPLTGVEIQSGKYLDGLPKELPNYHLPLPFAYESTGAVTRFTNALDPDARSREVFTFPRPEELLRLATLDHQPQDLLKQMPPLNVEGLWPLRITTISNRERSLADNRPRSLIQMATGSGKTLTAVIASYRLIKFAKARRIRLLEDRNNLGKQTLNEFQQYVSPYIRPYIVSLLMHPKLTTISALPSRGSDDEAAAGTCLFAPEEASEGVSACDRALRWTGISRAPEVLEGKSGGTTQDLYSLRPIWLDRRPQAHPELRLAHDSRHCGDYSTRSAETPSQRGSCWSDSDRGALPGGRLPACNRGSGRSAARRGSG